VPLVNVFEVEESEVLVPVELVCQYQVNPLGGVDMVMVVLPQVLVIVGSGACPGT
jgi:hypothetical protein